MQRLLAVLLCLAALLLAGGCSPDGDDVSGDQVPIQGTPLEASESAAKRPVITFSTPLPLDTPGSLRHQLVYKEAFRRIGFDFRLESYPVKRALHLADTGQTDGDVSRIHDLARGGLYQNLVRIEEQVGEAIVAGYSLRDDIRLQGWTSLGEDWAYKLIVGYQRGFRAAENNVPTHVPQSRIIVTSDPELMIRMLLAGRIDLLIEPERVADMWLTRADFKEAGVRKVGVLERVPTYGYLHKKHAALAPKVADALREMKKDGSFSALIEKAAAPEGDGSH